MNDDKNKILPNFRDSIFHFMTNTHSLIFTKKKTPVYTRSLHSNSQSCKLRQ